MVVRYGPLAAAGGDDRDVCRFGQFDESLFRVGPRHPATSVNQGQASPGDESGSFPKLFRAGHDSRDRSRIPQLDFLPLHSGFGRNFNEDGPRTTGTHLPERFRDGIRHFAGPEYPSAPLGHGTHHIRLVRNFMHRPEVLANSVARNLAGYHKNGRGAGVRGSQAAL